MYGSWTLLRAASRRSSAPELSHEGFLFHREVVENSCQTKFRKEIPGSWLMLASFPGSCAWAEKKNLVHTVCACSVPPGFLGILEISVKPVCYTNLRETCRLFVRERCLPLTTLCVDDEEGAIKAISSSLTGIIHASVRSS